MIAARALGVPFRHPQLWLRAPTPRSIVARPVMPATIVAAHVDAAKFALSMASPPIPINPSVPQLS